MEKKIIKQTGTALLVTLLLAGAISFIAFGMTKITLNEIFVGTKGQEGLEAQYAAQAGVEDALMRYKFHDKTNLEIPTGAQKDTTQVLRVYINDPSKNRLIASSNKPRPNPDDYIYDLKVWSKEDCTATNPCEYKIKKDEAITLDTSDITGTINVSWDLYNKNDHRVISLPASEANKTGLWYRLSDPQNPKQIDPTGQSRDFFTFLNYYNQSLDPTLTDQRFQIPNIRIPRSGGALSIRSAQSLKFKAFIADTLHGNSSEGAYIQVSISSISSGVIGGPQTHIESTGYFGNTAKKIEVTVDRENKSIINVFDYVIYSGSGTLPR